MTAGWAALNTLRGCVTRVVFDEDGDGAIVVGRTSEEDADAALALVQTALEAAEPMANLPWPLSTDERREWITNQNRLRDALRAVREGNQ